VNKIKILAADTSGVQAGAAIIEIPGACENSSYITVGEITLNARTGENSWTHSEILMPGIAQLFKLTRLQPSDINYIAYTNGPGSFTGLRIGAASALGIAHALNIPAIPVPTLDALAYNVLGVAGSGIVVPMLDARRGQVYTAVYSRNQSGFMQKITDFLALPVEIFLDEFLQNQEPVLFLGDGADANAELILEKIPHAVFAPANNNRQRAASVAVCAAEKIKSGCSFPGEVELLYIRAPQAVRQAAEKAAATGAVT